MPDNTTDTTKQREIGEALFAEYMKGHSEEVRNKIVEHYLYLAEILSKKYAGRGIDYDDLYQVASMALLLSVERFDPSKGFAFTSFATPTIIGEIKKYFRDKSWVVQVPRRVKELSLHIGDAREKLQAKNGKAPTVPELAELMDCSEEEVLEAMESGQTFRTYSLNQVIDSESDEGPASFDKYMSVEEKGYENFEDADLIRNVIAGLTDKERAIFGERVLGTKTQQEVAQEYGVSQMTISRLEAEIREKFRKEYYK
ncbi:MAG: SigB/SigF/SigG family RNA polymerase sigma factor [Clostridiales Family XIII bacterium]|jgi:RNA polymerase sigma-B factor|nr:SigB/SigF/SigG family RNA polymerase sigma factor [Clostridiales Family XIII bacterium]